MVWKIPVQHRQLGAPVHLVAALAPPPIAVAVRLRRYCARAPSIPGIAGQTAWTTVRSYETPYKSRRLCTAEFPAPETAPRAQGSKLRTDQAAAVLHQPGTRCSIALPPYPAPYDRAGIRIGHDAPADCATRGPSREDFEVTI